MAISQAVCTSFLQEMLEGRHDFRTTGNTFKIALYSSSASLDSATTVYSATNEVAGAGYVAGGTALTNVNPATSGTTSYLDWADASWPASTITARGALIYNSSVGNRAICALDFGTDKTSSASAFTVVFPSADANSAIIRFAA